jgi:hypothetical protein
MDPGVFIRLCVDPIRLAVLGQSAAGPVDAAELAAVLGVGERNVVAAKGRLQASGLLDVEGRLDLGVLRSVAMALPSDPPASPELLKGAWSPEEAEILSRFFSGDRLVEIPGHQAKRRVILERLVQEFEPGVRYPERQVNFILQLFHADYAALRRYLIDEELLTRADGMYWRTGGRFPETE